MIFFSFEFKTTFQTKEPHRNFNLFLSIKLLYSSVIKNEFNVFYLSFSLQEKKS